MSSHNPVSEASAVEVDLRDAGWRHPGRAVRNGLDSYAEADRRRLSEWDAEYYAQRTPSALMARAWRSFLVYLGFRAPEGAQPEVLGMNLGPEPVWEWDTATGQQVFRGNRRPRPEAGAASRPRYEPPAWHPEAPAAQFRPVRSSFHIIAPAHKGTAASLDAMISLRPDIQQRMHGLPAAVEWPIERFGADHDSEAELQTSLLGDLSQEESEQPSESLSVYLSGDVPPEERIRAALVLARFVRAMHSADVVLGGFSSVALRFQRDDGSVRLLVGFNPRVRIAGIDSPAHPLLSSVPTVDFTDDRRGLAHNIARLLSEGNGDVDGAVGATLGPACSRSLETLFEVGLGGDVAPYADEWLTVLGLPAGFAR